MAIFKASNLIFHSLGTSLVNITYINQLIFNYHSCDISPTMLLFLLRFYLFSEREGKERGRETPIRCLSHAPNWGPGLQPKQMSWLGIEQAIFWLARWNSIHGATSARASLLFKSPRRTTLCSKLALDRTCFFYSHKCLREILFQFYMILFS